MFLGKGVLKICSQFRGEHACRNARKMEITLNFICLILWYLFFFWKQFYNPKLKVIVIISSLIHLAISYNALSGSFNSVSVIVNLKNSPKNEFFTIEILYITYKINEFSTNMHFKLLTISNTECKSNHLYLKMALLLSGDINLNPGPARHHCY